MKVQRILNPFHRMENCPKPFNQSFQIPFPVGKNVKILKK